MNPYDQFKQECQSEVNQIGESAPLKRSTREWMNSANALKYSYHFEWMGRPIIQYPQDIVAMQELIWETQPDLIIESGIAHGGSLIFSASMLALLDVCDGGAGAGGRIQGRKVLGLDIDIRPHNRSAIEAHPLSSYIQMIQGSSINSGVIQQVHEVAAGYSRVMVCLDSNHTHEHVLAELEAYASLVSVGSYCVVFDTIIEDLPKSDSPNRPWGPGDNPKTAVRQYLKGHPEFVVDKSIENKLLITVAPEGYLRRIR